MALLAGKATDERVDLGWGVLVALFALLVRLAHVADAGMWEDEAFRYDLARGDKAHFLVAHGAAPADVLNEASGSTRLGRVSDTLRFLRDESPYAPGYYLVLHAAMVAGVTAPAGLGAVNALSGALLAFSLYSLARKGLGRGGAVLAGVLYALSPWDLGVCMQLKESAPAAALGFASTALLMRALRDGRWLTWLGSGVLLGSALLVQQQSAYWGPIQALLVLLFASSLRTQLPRAVAAWALAGLIYAPWLAWAGRAQLNHLKAVNRLFGGEWGGWSGLPERLTDYVGWSVAPLGPLALRSGTFAAVLGLLVLGFGVWGAVRREKAMPALRIVTLGAAIWLGALALAVFTYAVMKQNQALWPRYSPLFLPGAWLAIAAMVEAAAIRLWRGPLGWPAEVGLVVVGLGGALLVLPRPLDAIPLDRYADWRPVAQALESRAHDGDLVVHSPGANAYEAFIHLWPKATRHLVGGGPDEALCHQILASAQGAPVWLILSWGKKADLPAWQAFFAKEGWQAIEPPFAPAPSPFQRQDLAPAQTRISPDDITIAGFRPPAPPAP